MSVHSSKKKCLETSGTRHVGKGKTRGLNDVTNIHWFDKVAWKYEKN